MTRIVGSSAALIALVAATVVGAQERKMDVKQAPNAVFTSPVASLLPEQPEWVAKTNIEHLKR